jgi:hypothetical protein
MKTTLCVLLTILTSSLAIGQSAENSVKPDLSKYSSEQLKACQENPKLCGTDDSLSINDELATRLGKYTTDQILACYDDWKICGVEESRVTGWPISDFLASRGAPHDLLVRYWKERKFMIRNGIERVAYHFDTPEVTAFMQRVLIKRKDDGEDFYWPANYLAKKCDPLGLNELRTGRHRNQGSMQFQTTLALFGKCKYRPAIPYLAGEALYDFSGNIIDAAEESLDALYPDHPEKLDTLDDIRKYYCRRAKQEGFNVHCTTK